MRIRVGVLLAVAVAVTVARAQDPSDICTLQYGEGVVLHKSYKTGDQRCCKELTCPPGYQPVVCREDDPYTTNCERCPDNTFQSEDLSSSDLKQCSKKQECPEGMIREDDGSAVKDSRCVCDLNKGLCNSSKSRMMFCQTGSCPIGKELNNDCSCSDCVTGYYKAEEGSTRCKPWTNCQAEGKQIDVKGSLTADRVCKDKENNSRTGFPQPDVHSVPNSTKNPIPNEKNVIFVVITVVAVIVAVGVIIIVIVITRIWKGRKPNPETLVVEQPTNGQNNCPADANQRHSENGPLLQDFRIEREESQMGQQESPSPHAPIHLQIPQHSSTADSSRTPLQDETSVDFWRRKLNRCRVELVESLVVNATLLSVLLTNESITGFIKEYIQATQIRSEMAGRLLEMLERRPVYAFDTFICALIRSHQKHLAVMLDKDLTIEYDRRLQDIDISELVRSFVS